MDSENKERAKNKDYGFPFVEIVPVRPISNEPIVEASVPITEKPLEELKSIEIQRREKIISRPTALLEKKKKSKSPLLLSLILSMAVIMMAMAYLLYFLPNQKEEEPNLISEEIVNVEITPILIEEEILMEEENDLAEPIEVTDVLVDESEELNMAEIIPITEKGSLPSFYIIAGSLSNERLAKTEAKKILEKVTTVWLISPTGNTRNYRISVGKYDNLPSAKEALQKAKLEFDESLWILKH